MTDRSAAQFNAHADRYATSEFHRAGPSLPVLLRLAAPTPGDHALDVATGTGNTALALAPFVQDVTGVDVADAMLAHARERATRERLNNATFRSGDAEALPFPDGTFTLVTSRHAPHHFVHLDHFLAEAWRVLRPGGRLVIADQVSPSPEVQAWTDTYQRLRDPSHHAQRPVQAWQALSAQAGFTWAAHKIVPYELPFDWWTAQSGCTPDTVAALRAHAATLDAAQQEAAGLILDEHGKLNAHREPMLVVRLEKPGR
ncbi:UbiE/COQ5 family methyltransferase [Deinococcus grandis]|uniref:UbiE/COQ5 family methyltransferase n=1 Tax=Deinococcus grandis TaxID=57498 RepID=A0A100HLN5_9DEIO|nr:methyltransferase domain-containing protein [Deinococcus grandis]BBN93443.1 S-adenosyl-L-methionine (SAM)-dependent methyltransferase PhcB [Deinococcus grandis]GAQ23046.1 UbiE/COQ5 family methyltransferase [Deinococcus grandis]